jgi:hypothetical protein
MSVFGTTPGVGKETFEIPGMALPSLIDVQGLPSSTVLITSAGFAQNANVQFMQSLSRLIYVYSFGEQMGTVQISGIALWKECSGAVGTGIKEIMRYYQNNSVSARRSPVTITLVQERVDGFLRGVRTTFDDPTRGMTGFQLVFATMPDMWGD